jgi:hypothetical protein
MNGKGFGRKWSWPNLRYYADIRLEIQTETAKILNQHSRSPGPRFESETSRTQSRSVNHSTTTFGDSMERNSSGAIKSCSAGGEVTPDRKVH